MSKNDLFTVSKDFNKQRASLVKFGNQLNFYLKSNEIKSVLFYCIAWLYALFLYIEGNAQTLFNVVLN